MRPRTTTNESGVVAIVLTVVIVFALVAVVELTRTLQAAQSINLRVVDITGSVSGADRHLNTGCGAGQACSSALPVLSQTEAIVAQIDAAAKPLAGQAGQILDVVNKINVNASQILSSATSINGTVHSINSAAGTINGSVNSIASNIRGIDSTVVAIRGAPVPGSPFQSGLVGINNRADAVIALVNAIKADTGTINSDAQAILAQAHGISCDKVLGLVGPLSATC